MWIIHGMYLATSNESPILNQEFDTILFFDNYIFLYVLYEYPTNYYRKSTFALLVYSHPTKLSLEKRFDAKPFPSYSVMHRRLAKT